MRIFLAGLVAGIVVTTAVLWLTGASGSNGGNVRLYWPTTPSGQWACPVSLFDPHPLPCVAVRKRDGSQGPLVPLG